MLRCFFDIVDCDAPNFPVCLVEMYLVNAHTEQMISSDLMAEQNVSSLSKVFLFRWEKAKNRSVTWNYMRFWQCVEQIKTYSNMAVLQSGENPLMIEIQLMRFIKLPLSSCSVRNSGFWYFFPVCKPEFDFLVLHFKKDFESV